MVTYILLKSLYGFQFYYMFKLILQSALLINPDEKQELAAACPCRGELLFLSKRGFFTNICEETEGLSRRPGRLAHFHGPRFALGNRIYWVCRESSANCDAVRAALPIFSGPKFAPRNRIYWVCRESSANSDAVRAGFFISTARGSRIKTEYIWFPCSSYYERV